MGKYVERLQRIYGSDETSYDVYNTRSAVSLIKVGMVCTKKLLDEKKPVKQDSKKAVFLI